MLELQIGMIGWASKTGKPWTEDWAKVAGRPSAAWKLCRDQLPNMSKDLAADVRDLLKEAEPIRDARNKFAHAVFILDPELPDGDQWVLRSARSVEFSPLTEKDGADLVTDANRLSGRAQKLRKRAARERSQATAKS